MNTQLKNQSAAVYAIINLATRRYGQVLGKNGMGNVCLNLVYACDVGLIAEACYVTMLEGTV